MKSQQIKKYMLQNEIPFWLMVNLKLGIFHFATLAIPTHPLTSHKS